MRALCTLPIFQKRVKLFSYVRAGGGIRRQKYFDEFELFMLSNVEKLCLVMEFQLRPQSNEEKYLAYFEHQSLIIILLEIRCPFILSKLT
jgi:hypothetical protein